jgi:outer membrane immunogenic protein
MRRLAMMIAAAVFVGGGGFASAADLSMKDTPYVAAPALWTGYYIGGHVGGLWSSDDKVSVEKQKCRYYYCKEWMPAEYVDFSKHDDDTSFIGGVHAGYNLQIDRTVLGFEGDIDFADDIDYLASLRARLGYASGNFLIYATAGVAFAGFDDKAIRFSKPDFNYSLRGDGDDRKVGFVAGAGVEYMIREHWSVGVEGLFYRFSDDENHWGITEYDCFKYTNYDIKQEQDNDLWTVRARLTYHFADTEREVPLK